MAPFFRASDKPIATACFGLVTFCPLPERSFPCFMAFISRSTDAEAAAPYFFFALLFFLAGISVWSSPALWWLAYTRAKAR